MKEILTRKPKETLLHTDESLKREVIIVSSQKHESNYLHPHGIVSIMRGHDGAKAAYNVITPSGEYQFRKEGFNSIADLIEYGSQNGWRFFTLPQGNYNL